MSDTKRTSEALDQADTRLEEPLLEIDTGDEDILHLRARRQASQRLSFAEAIEWLTEVHPGATPDRKIRWPDEPFEL